MNRIEYKKRTPLNAEETDFVYTEIILNAETKRLIGFVVLQTYEAAETSFQIKKHDCAHEKYHIHHYYLGMHAKTEESNESITTELFWRAKRDIIENWGSYRARFQMKRSAQP